MQCIWRPRWNFADIFFRQKTKVSGLSYDVVCMILGLAILVELGHLTDGRAERHTITAYTALE